MSTSKLLNVYPEGKTPVCFVFRGSFNPITNGHLYNLITAIDNLKEDEFHIGSYIVPVTDAYQKKGLISSTHRIAMIKKSIEKLSYVDVDTYDSEQNQVLTNLEILNYFKNALQNYCPNVKIKMLCGSDTIESWNIAGLWTDFDMENILLNYHLTVCVRDNDDIDEYIKNNIFLTKYKNLITILIPIITNCVSSTNVRQLIRQKSLSPCLFMNETALKYAIDNQLYK